MTRPDGTVVPEPPAAPFFSIVEARAEIRASGGGTAKTIRRGDTK